MLTTCKNKNDHGKIIMAMVLFTIILLFIVIIVNSTSHRNFCMGLFQLPSGGQRSPVLLLHHSISNKHNLFVYEIDVKLLKKFQIGYFFSLSTL